MAIPVSDYIIFFIFVGVLLVFVVFMIARQLMSRHTGSFGSGLKRMLSGRRRSRSFSFRSTAEESSQEHKDASDPPLAPPAILKSSQIPKV